MSTPDIPIPSELLALYLTGEADAAQRRAVEEWAAASPDNAAELESMRRVWELGADAGSMPEVDVDAAWERLDQRIAEEEGRGRVRAIRPVLTRWLAAAAMLTGLAFGARWFFQPRTDMYMAHATPTEVRLADSSYTVLSPGSRMEVRMGRKRRVELEGQAYFTVQRDAQRPFIVDAGDVTVTVLGTAFEVTAYDTSAYVSVRVRSGRVRVEVGDERVELGAGDRVRYHRERHFLERPPAPPAEVWGLRILHFEDAMLGQVAAELERIYRVRIDLRNERIVACRLTAEFDDEAIGTILTVIAETFGLQLEETNGGYALAGDGC